MAQVDCGEGVRPISKRSSIALLCLAVGLGIWLLMPETEVPFHHQWTYFQGLIMGFAVALLFIEATAISH